MIETVVNHILDRDNPYQRALYSGIGDRYAAAPGRIEEAIARQRARGGGAQLLHLHWEERDLEAAPTPVEAGLVVECALEALDEFASLGGKTVWTAHSAALRPAAKGVTHMEAFLAFRRGLMARADRICVHNLQTIETLRAQSGDAVGPPAEKLHLLPHPSFLGVLAAPPPDPTAPRRTALLLAGDARESGVAQFLEAFEASGAGRRNIAVRVVGEPIPDGGADPGRGAEIKRRFGRAPGVTLQPERLDAADAFALIASAGCLVLTAVPSLTVSEAFAAMTCGAPVVGPDVPQLRDALPAENHPFLYNPDLDSDVMARIDALLSLSDASRAALEAALQKRAADHHPSLVSRRLGQLYDDLRL